MRTAVVLLLGLALGVGGTLGVLAVTEEAASGSDAAEAPEDKPGAEPRSLEQLFREGPDQAHDPPDPPTGSLPPETNEPSADGPEAMQYEAAEQGSDLDCRDFREQDFAPIPGDPHGLDSDGDGLACET
jgi:hypothetical protein